MTRSNINNNIIVLPLIAVSFEISIFIIDTLNPDTYGVIIFNNNNIKRENEISRLVCISKAPSPFSGRKDGRTERRRRRTIRLIRDGLVRQGRALSRRLLETKYRCSYFETLGRCLSIMNVNVVPHLAMKIDFARGDSDCDTDQSNGTRPRDRTFRLIAGRETIAGYSDGANICGNQISAAAVARQ